MMFNCISGKGQTSKMEVDIDEELLFEEMEEDIDEKRLLENLENYERKARKETEKDESYKKITFEIDNSLKYYLFKKNEKQKLNESQSPIYEIKAKIKKLIKNEEKIIKNINFFPKEYDLFEKKDVLPSLEELVLASSLAYKDDICQKLTQLKSLNNKGKKDFAEKWTPVCVAESSKSHYRGVVLLNVSEKKLIISHRGTAPTKKGSVEADLSGVMQNTWTKQINSACTLTLQVTKILKDLSEEFKWDEESTALNKIGLSITGHSLGGFLAQVSTYAAEYLELKRDRNQMIQISRIPKSTRKEFSQVPTGMAPHVRCVVFESPGARQILQRMGTIDNSQNQHNLDKLISYLDITEYVARPNLVNITNQHAGKIVFVYLTVEEKESLGSLIRSMLLPKSEIFIGKTIKGHSLQNFINAICDKKPCFLEMLVWPVFIYKNWDSLSSPESKSRKQSHFKNLKQLFASRTTIRLNSDLDAILKFDTTKQSRQLSSNAILLNVFTQMEIELLNLINISKNNLWNPWGNSSVSKLVKVIMNRTESITTESNHDKSVVIKDIVDWEIKRFINLVRNFSNKYLNTFFETFNNSSNKDEIKMIFRSQEIKDRLQELYLNIEFEDKKEGGSDKNIESKIIRKYEPVEIHKDLIHLKVLSIAEYNLKIQKKKGEILWLTKNLDKPSDHIKAVIINDIDNVVPRLENKNTEIAIYWLSDYKYGLQIKESSLKLISNQTIKFQETLIEFKEVFTNINLIDFNTYFSQNPKDFLKLVKRNPRENEILKICKRPFGFFDDIENSYIQPTQIFTISKFVENFTNEVIVYYGKDIFVNKFEENIEGHLDTFEESLTNLNQIYGDEKVIEKDFKEICRNIFNNEENTNMSASLFHCKLDENGKVVVEWKLHYNPNIYQARKCIVDNLEKSEADMVDYLFKNTSDNSFILKDIPGMGKSTFVSRLVDQIHMKHPNYLIIPITLQNIKSNFESFEQLLLEGLDFFRVEDVLEKFLLQTKLKNSKNSEICVIFDGFDEVNYKNKEVDKKIKKDSPVITSLKAVFKELKEEKGVKIVVTTRPNKVDIDILEQALPSVLQTSFIELSKEECILFLSASLHSQFRHFKFETLKTFATKAYEQSWENLKQSGVKNEDFLGVPLHIKLLCNAHVSDLNKNASTDLEPQKYSIIDMYEKYFESKSEIYFEQKLKCKIPIAKELANLYDKWLQAHSLKVLDCDVPYFLDLHLKWPYAQKNNHKVKVEDLDHWVYRILSIQPLNKSNCEELVFTGIVLQTGATQYDFLHRTFAEYYLAKITYEGILTLISRFGTFTESFVKDLVKILLRWIFKSSVSLYFLNEMIKRDSKLRKDIVEDYAERQNLIGKVFFEFEDFKFTALGQVLNLLKLEKLSNRQHVTDFIFYGIFTLASTKGHSEQFLFDLLLSEIPSQMSLVPNCEMHIKNYFKPLWEKTELQPISLPSKNELFGSIFTESVKFLENTECSKTKDTANPDVKCKCAKNLIVRNFHRGYFNNKEPFCKTESFQDTIIIKQLADPITTLVLIKIEELADYYLERIMTDTNSATEPHVTSIYLNCNNYANIIGDNLFEDCSKISIPISMNEATSIEAKKVIQWLNKSDKSKEQLVSFVESELKSFKVLPVVS